MEFVYVIRREDLFPDCYPQGFAPFEGPSEQAAFVDLARTKGFFVERAYAERTPGLKQLIPYCVLTCEDRILVLKRLAAGGEARLHDKLSIGVGGHINPPDATVLKRGPAGSPTPDPERQHDPNDPIANATRREIAEELEIEGSYDVRTVGILNDDSNSVGAVHVGIVQHVTVYGSVGIRERDQLEGECVTRTELRGMYSEGANFETWSSMLIPRLDDVLTVPPPSLPSPTPSSSQTANSPEPVDRAPRVGAVT